jgi:hypothetical protein
MDDLIAVKRAGPVFLAAFPGRAHVAVSARESDRSLSATAFLDAAGLRDLALAALALAVVMEREGSEHG